MKAFSSLTVITVALLLQGYVTTAVVGTAAIGAKAAMNPCGVGTQADGSVLKLCASTALSKDAQIKKEVQININAYQSKALLVGQSLNSELSARAKQIAMGVEGTTEVFNGIRQGQPIGLGDTSNDTRIATKACSQLFTSDQVKSSNVKVTTENGEVLLLGLVTERKAKVVADIANRVGGMKRVMTALTFIKQHACRWHLIRPTECNHLQTG